MELIMAFGKMEKNNARKRNERNTSSSVRSNSIKVLSTHNHIILTKYFFNIRQGAILATQLLMPLKRKGGSLQKDHLGLKVRFLSTYNVRTVFTFLPTQVQRRDVLGAGIVIPAWRRNVAGVSTAWTSQGSAAQIKSVRPA